MGRLFDGQLVPLKKLCSRQSLSTLKEEVNLVKNETKETLAMALFPDPSALPRAACTVPRSGALTLGPETSAAAG